MFGWTVSYPCIKTSDGLFFVPMDCSRTLLDFLSVCSLFYERTIRFYGSCLLNINLLIPEAQPVLRLSHCQGTHARIRIGAQFSAVRFYLFVTQSHHWVDARGTTSRYSASRKRNRCNITGRSRGVYKKFGLSRHKLREAAMRGEVPGLKKASW